MRVSLERRVKIRFSEEYGLRSHGLELTNRGVSI
jgi:hypothetical protein